MAVQAQYPSNVLLLNRNAPDGIGIDCSLQPQPGGAGGGGGAGGFLDHQTHMLFSNGGAATNTRKRGRESSAAAASASNNIASSGNMIANPFTLQQQPQPLQLINLSQLHYNPRPQQSGVVSTGLRLSFNDQHQHQHQQSLVRESINPVSSLLPSDDFAAHVKQQRDEIDQFLLAQGEQLRRTLAEKRQRQYRALLCAAEETVARRLREKEAEVEKATRQNAELEARAAQLSVEAQVWQAKARAQEAAAASLQAQLQQAIISGGHDNRASPEDGGGCGGSDAEDAESAYVDPDRVVVSSGPGCRACRRRVAVVVLLPCRHLCVCAECNRVAHACPVCFTVRESSVEVYLP
ncbi:E3 ubiquitin-protein ligase BOI-like isoform X2 [Punica granatum]|uniref:E3 ubiquitin-protein ligase BOI-like isoform X2 n=1 Tax=Punica granatum TaxID=22663 RepID=A0A218XNX5_PUNGR|nr:E3 ubiquitin-protein ligase BOI-like isoform X2 [Punica granatum]OWM86366.1 hypothetical protein CDL15_Pgr021452 [Punica granatum]